MPRFVAVFVVSLAVTSGVAVPCAAKARAFVGLRDEPEQAETPETAPSDSSADSEAEFERICRRIWESPDVSPGLSKSQIEALIAESPVLSSTLARSEDSGARELIERLESCKAKAPAELETEPPQGREVVEPTVKKEALPERSEARAEFDRICGQVQAAPDLSSEEIQELILASTALSEALTQSEGPQAKVLIKRLEMCREFFEWLLEVE